MDTNYTTNQELMITTKAQGLLTRLITSQTSLINQNMNILATISVTIISPSSPRWNKLYF